MLNTARAVPIIVAPMADRYLAIGVCVFLCVGGGVMGSSGRLAALSALRNDTLGQKDQIHLSD